MSDPIVDPFSETNRHASVMREFYDAYVRSGFSEAEAFAMTLVALRAALGQR